MLGYNVVPGSKGWHWIVFGINTIFERPRLSFSVLGWLLLISIVGVVPLFGPVLSSFAFAVVYFGFLRTMSSGGGLSRDEIFSGVLKSECWLKIRTPVLVLAFLQIFVGILGFFLSESSGVISGVVGLVVLFVAVLLSLVLYTSIAVLSFQDIDWRRALHLSLQGLNANWRPLTVKLVILLLPLGPLGLWFTTASMALLTGQSFETGVFSDLAIPGIAIMLYLLLVTWTGYLASWKMFYDIFGSVSPHSEKS
ncbi:MAG: hypothetical protein N2578_04560 [Bdellovibrionaceae bacterium]|nr:hypothetical protein [Pseudobdellovibrionaceae bacterium]